MLIVPRVTVTVAFASRTRCEKATVAAIAATVCLKRGTGQNKIILINPAGFA